MDLDTGAVVRRATPGRRGRHDDAGEDAGGGQGESQAVDAAPTVRRPGRMRDRQGLSLTVGLKGARRKTRISEPKQKGFARGTATGRPAGQSILSTGPGCYRAWPRKPSSCAPRSSLAPLIIQPRSGGMRQTWCAGARTCQAIPAPCRRPQSESALMRKLIGAGTPREAVPGGMAAVFACYLRQLEPFWSLRWSSSSRRMAKPPSPRYVSPSRKPGQ